MQMSMDAILPSLRPEQRKLIEGRTDLNQLIIPLFESWEVFRSQDRGGNKSRKIAKSVYEKLQKSFTNNELFERFWARKLVAETDEAAWGKFKSTVSTLLSQVSSIDRILNGSNSCNASSSCNITDNSS
jgi:hypothetical protein